MYAGSDTVVDIPERGIYRDRRSHTLHTQIQCTQTQVTHTAIVIGPPIILCHTIQRRPRCAQLTVATLYAGEHAVTVRAQSNVT